MDGISPDGHLLDIYLLTGSCSLPFAGGLFATIRVLVLGGRGGFLRRGGGLSEPKKENRRRKKKKKKNHIIHGCEVSDKQK